MSEGSSATERGSVLIAGASSGIGHAVAERTAASGRRVVLLARRRAELVEVLDHIRRAGGCGDLVVGDASDADSAEEAVALAARDSNLVALVNCVGANIPGRALRALTPAAWQEMIKINLGSAYALTQAVLPVFRAQSSGLLIHLASRSVKQADGSGAAYQAAKAGVAALAHATSVEEQVNGIRVSVVYPGLTDTPLVLQRPVPPSAEELARALRPEDVARVVDLLLDLPPRAHIPDISIFPTN